MARKRFLVVGHGGSGAAWLSAIRASQDAELLALVDRDQAVGSELAAQFDIPHFDDSRSMILQTAADAIAVALSPAGIEKLLPMAAERKMHVVADDPSVRTVESAAAAVQRFEDARLQILIASGWRLGDQHRPLREAIGSIGRVLQATARIAAPWPAKMGWRGDSERGGGVLACEAYEAIDIITTIMGLPSDITVRMARLLAPGPEPYDTEDTAAVLMRFGDGRSATISARWGAKTEVSQLHFAGNEQDASFDLRMSEANVCDDQTMRKAAVSKLIAAMDEQDLSRPGRPTDSRLRDHLTAIAVLETCRLAGRTGAPESPQLVLDRSGITQRRGR